MKFPFTCLRAVFLAATFVSALAPVAALADANPNNHGHHYHYGWVNHHSPPPAPAPKPTPKPTGGGTTTGPTNNFKGVVPTTLAEQAPGAPVVVPPEAPVLQPPGSVVTIAQPLLEAANVWLVAILLAAFVAANVAAVVLLTGRGGHYALRRALAPVGIRL